MEVKTGLDMVTLQKRLDVAMKVPEDAIAHTEEVSNNFEKDASKRSLLYGSITRKFVMSNTSGLKGSCLCLDFRPMADTIEKLNFFILVNLIRNGKNIDRRIIKKTKKGILKANANNIMKFILTDKRTLNTKSLEDGDVLEVIFKSETKQINRVYFANLYITKE